MTAVAQVLRDAATEIERARELWDFGGAAIVYWVAEVTDSPDRDGPASGPWRRQLFQDAMGRLAEHLNPGPGSPATLIRDWETVPLRTVTEVLAALRACADKEEADA